MIHLNLGSSNNWLTYIFLLAALLLIIAAIANTLLKIRSIKEFIKNKQNNKESPNDKIQNEYKWLKSNIALVLFLILLVVVAGTAWFVSSFGNYKMTAPTIILTISFFCGISFGAFFLLFLYKRINK